MKKQSAFDAWKMLILSLPKGIAAFIIAVVGLSVSLPLSVFLIGIPLLATVLILCRRMLDAEQQLADAWKRGEKPAADAGAASGTISHGQASAGWKGLLSVFRSSRAYRSIFYSLSQLPVGIVAFTLALVLPITAFAVMLTPLAWWISDRYFDFDLIQSGWTVMQLFPELTVTSFQLSWVYGGVGALLVLLQPLVFRTFGRFYAVWIEGIAGSAPEQPVEQQGYAYEASYSLEEALQAQASPEPYKA